MEDPYKSPALVDFLVRNFNEKNVGKISLKEEDILMHDSKLAKAVFESNLKDLIGAGYVSIEELKKKPALQDALQNKYITNAVTNGVLSIGHLEKISPRKLEEVTAHIVDHTADRVSLSKMLDLPPEKAQAFIDSMDKLDHAVPSIIMVIPLGPAPGTTPQAPAKVPPINTI